MTITSDFDKPSFSHCYNEYHSYSLQLNRWFLKPIGAWPESYATTIAKRLLPRIIQITCYILIAFVVVPSLLYFYLEEQDLDTKLDLVGPVSHWIMSAINYTSLLWRGKDIRCCIKHMENDWYAVSRSEDCEAMIKYAKFGRSVAGFCAVFMHCGVFSYSAVNSLTPIVTVIGNETISARKLPCPFYSKLLDTSRTPANEIVLALQFLSGFIVNSVTVGACSLAAVFAMHACGQFAVLYMWLNELVDEEKKEQYAEYKLANIVEHHLRVLNFLSRVENIMNQICLVEVVGCTLNLCLLGFCSIKEWNAGNTKTIATYSIVFISVSFNIFIFCYIGEIITEQCKKVGEMAYFTNWYRLPHKTALGMVLIISRSSAVIKITAGKLIHLSLMTFGDVIKTSAAYLNILRTITIAYAHINNNVIEATSPMTPSSCRRMVTMCRSVTEDLHDHSVQLNRWFLKPIGAWPRFSSSTGHEKAMSRALIVTCFSLIAFTVIPCALNVLFEEKNIELKLRAIGPLSHWLMGGINYCSLLLRSADIRRCVRHMRMDWQIIRRSEDREIMARNAKLGRFVAGFCAICMHGGVFAYSIVSGMTTVMMPIDENRSVEMLQLPCPSYSKFVDARFSPANEIVLVMQLISGFIVNSTTVGACSLAAVFAMHACGQLDILILRLYRLVEGDGKKRGESAQKRLAEIVDHHLRVLRFIARIEDVMHQVCLVELVGCTFNLCMLGYYSITWWNKIDRKSIAAYIVVYISMSFNIFIFCYIGEILTQQCKKVGEIAYMTDWYRLPHKTALGLILVISRSSVVIKITAGKLIQLSIATFSDVSTTNIFLKALLINYYHFRLLKRLLSTSICYELLQHKSVNVI
ncbi:uncharacterized protein LOC105432488 [Pogonomyrmex barbatus]|uniref:Uncharacterized protein LOC105432488 n=1 Tax=Pogonomyrmex barbatus TaxID=144034 RepID=A0A8N1S8R1_9HYME|nr:uncharacterized protein LOC105432488 [Pogonomyrmex barbatus]